MQKSNQIICQPFLGNASNFFDQFILLGYSNDEKSKDILRNIKQQQQNNLANILKDNTSEKESLINIQQMNKSILYEVYENSTKPTVLHSICYNNSNQIGVDASNVVNFIFPNKPKIYFINNSEDINNNLQIENYLSKKENNVIFCLNSDSIKNQEKNLIYGYGYVFYEKWKSFQCGLYLIPKAFVFLCKYPYYSHLNTLAKDIHKIFISSQIPIEIILFNIINYTPGQMKCDFTLNYFPENYYNNKQYAVCKMRYPFISGYPLIDFNAYEILNILPVELIIKTFIFNFLEIDMIVFSNTLELLNVFLFFLYFINYPCNDTIYLWHIISISKEELINQNVESKFIGKPFTTMIGIHCSYNENINTSRFSHELIIVDLDKKEIKYKAEENKTSKILSLFKYLNSVFETKAQKIAKYEQNIRILYEKLENIAIKIINSNNTPQNKYKPNFFKLNENNYQQNKFIQELFYSFTLNCIKPLYNSFRFDISFISTNKNSNIQTEYPIIEKIQLIEWEQNEQVFYELFQNTNKYSFLINNFLYNYEALDNYKLPLLFSEIFLNSGNSYENEFSIGHFDIIDSFYQKNCINQNNIDVTCNTYFICNYNSLIKKLLKRNIILHSNQMINTFSTRKKIELDSNILYQYINIINNYNVTDLLNIFPTNSFMSNNNIKVEYLNILNFV